MATKPTKLLMTLLLGLGSLTFVSAAAWASDGSKDSKDSKDSESKSASAASGCRGTLITSCGLKLIKTTCSGAASSSKSYEVKSEENDDAKHESKANNSENKNDRDYVEESHRDHRDRSQDSEGNKVSICHRMGGAEVSLLVANDGWLSGHSKHPLDTIGRCADFDDKEKSAKDEERKERDEDTKISASTAGYASGLTPSQISCLKGSPSETYSVNGVSYPGGGINTNNPSISFNIQSSTQGPSRGGARTLR
jgi:hypothetical protein